MKAKLFLLVAMVAGVMLTDASAQTDTSRKKSKTDTTSRSQKHKKDNSGNKRDTLGRRDTGWQGSRPDRENELNKNTRVEQRDDTPVTNLTADWPEASRKAVEEMREKYGEPDIANEDRVVWKDKGNWEMIIINKDDKQKQLSAKDLDRLRQADSDRPGRNELQ